MHWLFATAVMAAVWTPDSSKCAFGIVENVRGARVTLRTTAGPVDLKLPPRIAAPRRGDSVRAYYVLNDGALVTRIDRLASPRHR